MKKSIVLVLAIVVLAVVVGCSSTNAVSSIKAQDVNVQIEKNSSWESRVGGVWFSSDGYYYAAGEGYEYTNQKDARTSATLAAEQALVSFINSSIESVAREKSTAAGSDSEKQAYQLLTNAVTNSADVVVYGLESYDSKMNETSKGTYVCYVLRRVSKDIMEQLISGKLDSMKEVPEYKENPAFARALEVLADDNSVVQYTEKQI